MSELKLDFPTETVELPSKGLVYPKANPLSSGKIEMKYMTAKEEDILTNQNYIKDGTVIDKLLKALIVTKIDYDDLIVGDKNAIMVAARVLGYGGNYSFIHEGQELTIDLSELKSTYLDESKLLGVNMFEFTLPHSEVSITFKLPNNKDEKAVQSEVKGLQKIDKRSSPELSTRLKHTIISVNGDDDKKVIREFVDKYMLARDSRAFREYVKTIQPDVELKFEFEGTDGTVRDLSLPVTVNFFWPDAEL